MVLPAFKDQVEKLGNLGLGKSSFFSANKKGLDNWKRQKN
jgi:hypothetical protein